MRSFFISLILLVFISLKTAGSTDQLSNANLWEIDPEHFKVCFTIQHLGIDEGIGFFMKFSGSMESASDDFFDAEIQLVVDVNSIESNNEARNIHIKSDDFFNVDPFSEMRFVNKAGKKQKVKYYILTAELTTRDFTKDVLFDVEYLGTVSVTGMQKLALKAQDSIKHFDFDINWNATIPDGIQVIDEKVSILLNLELNQAS